MCIFSHFIEISIYISLIPSLERCCHHFLSSAVEYPPKFILFSAKIRIFVGCIRKTNVFNSLNKRK